ncbi:hypothetical protein BS50DRAFT_629207 [Corynespora cassiicola Philippines]|uniref:C2H2-type domain-containing protein n=1 Tax=Corynespora cassiicola Philippines TaxID=1448308 RepID=A0A2T2P6J2_CORCC|nr:hypothetical protein BS50DRAFT_629207 [Corynespora cassiicola Philippines]
MAYGFSDNDRDSAFGDDDFLWNDPMFSPLSAPLAGTKRDADAVRHDDAQPAPPGFTVDREHRAEHIDPQVLCCRTCPEVPCCEPLSDSRPSKRRASALKVGKFHSVADEHSNFSQTHDTDQQFLDTCFDKFCQGCDLETSCESPCALPCPGDAQCTEDDACFDPRCDQRECADQCVDPECTKVSCPNDPCFCQKCHAQPCPLGDPNNECHLAHSGPTTAGTIYCYDNVPCHFQEGYHDFNSNLGVYETYPCFTQSHVNSAYTATAQVSSANTPVLSPGNYTSLDSTFSHPSSPAPGLGNTSQCFLNIPFDHCHIDNSCCHGSSRACGDCPSASQNHLDIWSSSIAHGNGLASSFMNFGLHPNDTSTTLGLDDASANATSLSTNYSHSMLGMDDPSWMLPDGSFSMTNVTGPNKLDFLASAITNDILKQDPSLVNSPSLEAGTTFGTPSIAGTTGDSAASCICKWQHGPGLLCLAMFDSAEALHKHIKSAHVDNCTRCFCQWEGCEACSKDFKQRSKLSRHLLGHAGYRPYRCSFEGCGKTFATNQAKDNHERTHTGDRPYVCDRCGYTTTTHTQLQTHISALHEGKKPHKCRFCDFTCADSSNLSKHERTHQTLRPYRCPHPGCTFKPDCRWENLKRHLRRSSHCPQLLVEGSQEYKTYRESVRREIDEWHKRNEDGGLKMARRKGRG